MHTPNGVTQSRELEGLKPFAGYRITIIVSGQTVIPTIGTIDTGDAISRHRGGLRQAYLADRADQYLGHHLDTYTFTSR